MESLPLYQQLSATVYKALKKTENQQDALKELNQKDRAIVLIALNNIRYAGEPNRVTEIRSEDSARVVQNLKNRANHVPSGFFCRLLKGIQNLFGRITSATLMSTFSTASVTRFDTLLQQKQDELKATQEKIKKSPKQEEFNRKLCTLLTNLLNADDPSSRLDRAIEKPEMMISIPGLATALNPEDKAAIREILTTLKDQTKSLQKREQKDQILRIRGGFDMIATDNELSALREKEKRLGLEVQSLIAIKEATDFDSSKHQESTDEGALAQPVQDTSADPVGARGVDLSSSSLPSPIFSEVVNPTSRLSESEIREKLERLTRLRDVAAEIEELTNFLGLQSLGPDYDSLLAEYKQVFSEVANLEDIDALLKPGSIDSGKTDSKRTSFSTSLDEIRTNYYSAPASFIERFEAEIKKMDDFENYPKSMLLMTKDYLSNFSNDDPEDLLFNLSEAIKRNKAQKVAELSAAKLQTISDPSVKYTAAAPYTIEELYAEYKQEIIREFKLADNYNRPRMEPKIPDDVQALLSGELTQEKMKSIVELRDSIGKFRFMKSEGQWVHNPASFASAEYIVKRAKEFSNFLDIAKQKSLPKLSLAGIGLATIPEEIRKYEGNLEELDLSNNGLMALPDWIGNFKNLKKLSLEGNKLKALPDTIGELEALEELSLDYNQITTLPLAILKLKNLKKISFVGNPLVPMPAEIKQFIQDSLWGKPVTQYHPTRLEDLPLAPSNNRR